MNKKHLIFLAIIILVILGICIWLFCNKNYKNITIKEDDICIGTMCYSYMLGIDAGTEYLVSIYYNDGNTYKYEVTEGNITIVGYRAENKKVNGIINSKDDLIKLDEKYINAAKTNTKPMVSTVRRIFEKRDLSLSDI